MRAKFFSAFSKFSMMTCIVDAVVTATAEAEAIAAREDMMAKESFIVELKGGEFLGLQRERKRPLKRNRRPMPSRTQSVCATTVTCEM